MGKETSNSVIVVTLDTAPESVETDKDLKELGE